MYFKTKYLAVISCLLIATSLLLFSCVDDDAAVVSSSSDSSSESTSTGDTAVGGIISDSSSDLTSEANSSEESKITVPSSSIAAAKDAKLIASPSSSKAASSAAPSKAASSKAASPSSASSKAHSSSAQSSKAASSAAASSAASGNTGETDYGPRLSDDPSQSSDTSFSSSVEDEILTKLNDLRTSLGLSALKKSSSLKAGARIRAKEMYDYNYFAHTRPDGGSWDSVFKIDIPLSGYSYLGENLAKTTGMSPSSSYFMELWTNSPGHYENMVRENYTHVGIGVYYGYIAGKGKIAYAVQEFGTFK
ncbi:MAG: CAP domain-containing protein [Acetanaerobacterium sp.]